jgi:hypothetical protein
MGTREWGLKKENELLSFEKEWEEELDRDVELD